jgi:hypothetical protein
VTGEDDTPAGTGGRFAGEVDLRALSPQSEAGGMATALRRVRARSLHAMAPGESARITGILFEQLRAECAHRGLRPGQRVRCRAAGPQWLILETDEGRRVLLERDWARFVEVG